MKINVFIISILISFFACVPSKEIPIPEYELFPAGAKLSEYVGKKIYFKARVCDFEMQHMLRSSLDETSEHFCIDQTGGNGKYAFQILAYTDQAGMKMVEKCTGKVFTIYGTIDSITGAGQGGGEHTEYYLEFDKLDIL